jgi:hypothetical protein
MGSTGLTRARRSQAALALDPIPASKVQSDPLEIAELPRKLLHMLTAGRFTRIT